MLGTDIELEDLINAFTDVSGVTLQIHQNFKPLVATQAYVRMYGFDSVEDYLKLDSIMSLIPENLHEVAKQRYRQIMETGYAEPVTVETKRLDGARLFLKVQDRRLKKGDEYCVLTVLVDVTDEVILKDKFEQVALAETEARAELQGLQDLIIEQEKQAAVNSLLVGVSHQLNTPLGNIRMASSKVDEVLRSVQIALSQQKLTETQLRECLDQALEATALIEQDVRGSDRLIQNVKKMVSRDEDAERSHFNLRALVDEILGVFLTSREDLTVHIDVDIDENLHAFANPNVWMQVLTVLCENSIQHAFMDRSEGRVRVQVHKHGSKMRFEFSDDGLGLPESERTRVFEPFYSSQMGRSSGLGLTLLYNRVTADLDGTVILIQPVFGRGMSIRLELPIGDFSNHAPNSTIA